MNDSMERRDSAAFWTIITKLSKTYQSPLVGMAEHWSLAFCTGSVGRSCFTSCFCNLIVCEGAFQVMLILYKPAVLGLVVADACLYTGPWRFF